LNRKGRDVKNGWIQYMFSTSMSIITSERSDVRHSMFAFLRRKKAAPAENEEE